MGKGVLVGLVGVGVMIGLEVAVVELGIFVTIWVGVGDGRGGRCRGWGQRVGTCKCNGRGKGRDS